MSFAARIKWVRDAFGLGQKKLGEIAGQDYKNVSKWEKDAFQPKDNVKKTIADSLKLSLQWLISGHGCPFKEAGIAILRPTARNFDSVFNLVSAATQESKSSKAMLWRLRNQKNYFSLLFQIDGHRGSIALVDCPLGHETAFLNFIQKEHNLDYLGIGASEDANLERNLTTSFDFVFGKILEADFKKPDTRIPKAYFFIDLYNMDKNELMRFIHSRAQTLGQKINKVLSDKYIPDFLSVFPHHHSDFKKIVRAWLKGTTFTEKERTILENFTKESKLSSIFLPPKFVWDKFLIDGIKTNVLEPFSFAYTELMSLIYHEWNKKTVVRPNLDVKHDRLFWSD
ncbi:MAG: helix-turn-helix domain-containing protein [Dissulfurispiraceae bacterium]